MRLIDADALKELIADKLDERFRWDSKLTVCEFKTIVGDIIDKAPTVAEAGKIEDGITLNPMTEEEVKRFIETWHKASTRVLLTRDPDTAAEEAMKEAEREAHYLDDGEDSIAGRWHS